MFLNCHTFHSLRYGTLSVPELVKLGVENGARALALTDINTVTGIYEFYKECLLHQIKPIVGMEIRVEGELYYTCLAKNPEGLAEINKMVTEYNCDGIEIPKHHPELNDVFVIYPVENLPEHLAPNELIGIRPEETNILVQREWKEKLKKWWSSSPWCSIRRRTITCTVF